MIRVVLAMCPSLATVNSTDPCVLGGDITCIILDDSTVVAFARNL